MGTRFALRGRQAQELRELGEKSTAIRAREIEAYWMTLPYTDASQPGFMDKFLATIDMPSLGLSTVQQDKLQARLRTMTDYLLHPSSEASSSQQSRSMRCGPTACTGVKLNYSQIPSRHLARFGRERQRAGLIPASLGFVLRM
jgi:hypothetical protein